MTSVRSALPLLRPPELADTPALSRISVALLWLVIGLLGRPLSTAFLVLAAVIVLVMASGYTLPALWNVSWRYLLLIGLVAAATFVLSIDSGRQVAAAAALLMAVRLALILVLALLVVLPQDAEAVVDESIRLLHLPARPVFGLLIVARVVAAAPRDMAQFRAARRARDMARRGLLGLVIEPLAAADYLARAARLRRRELGTRAQLAGLASGPRRTMYRSVSFGRNGRYVLVAGAIVALASLIIGLI